MAEEPLDKKMIVAFDSVYARESDIKEALRLTWNDVVGRYSIKVQNDFKAILIKRFGKGFV